MEGQAGGEAQGVADQKKNVQNVVPEPLFAKMYVYKN
jgi:hypothetical protein